MTRTIALLMSFALTAAAPAFAQDSTATTGTETPAPTSETAPAAQDATGTTGAEATAQTETTPPTDEAPVDNGLSMGADGTTPEAGEVAIGQPYVKEAVGDWQLQCVKAEEGEDPCQLYQLLKDEDGNAVAEFSLFRLPDGGKATAGATVVVPLETALNEDLRLGIDGSQGKRYRFSFCSPVGCFARIGLTADDVAAMKRGNTANLTIVPWAAPDVQVKLNMSLIGFTAGFDKVTVAAARQR